MYNYLPDQIIMYIIVCSNHVILMNMSILNYLKKYSIQDGKLNVINFFFLQIFMETYYDRFS